VSNSSSSSYILAIRVKEDQTDIHDVLQFMMSMYNNYKNDLNTFIADPDEIIKRFTKERDELQLDSLFAIQELKEWVEIGKDEKLAKRIARLKEACPTQKGENRYDYIRAAREWMDRPFDVVDNEIMWLQERIKKYAKRYDYLTEKIRMLKKYEGSTDWKYVSAKTDNMSDLRVLFENLVESENVDVLFKGDDCYDLEKNEN